MLRTTDKLLADLDQQPLRPPLYKIPEGAEIVGELPDELKRLRSRSDDAKRKAEHIGVDIVFAESHEQRLVLQRESSEAVYEQSVLEMVFALEVKAHFGLFSDCTVAVAEGWQVVILKEEPSISSLFGPMSGFARLFRLGRGKDEGPPPAAGVEEEGDHVGQPGGPPVGGPDRAPAEELEGGSKTEPAGAPGGEVIGE